MSCRVARLSQDYTNMDLVSCCECGSPNPEVFYTLKTLGPHRCPICTQSKVEHGVAESMTRSPRGGVQPVPVPPCNMNVSPPEGLAMQDKKYSPWIEDKEGRLMKTSLFKSLGFGLVVGGLALAVSACNTTKATYDTLVKFSSSTSPGELFTSDGLVKKNQKVNLYTAIVFENLQQDMARGSGEYLASLSVLLDIPPDRQHEWGLFTQSQYSFLFPSERATSSELLARLGRELAANPRTSERIGE